MSKKKVGFVGTDGRSFLAALETSRAKSEHYPDEYEGFVVRGTSAMQPFAERMSWQVGFIPTGDNTVAAYADALQTAFGSSGLDYLDYALIMPEALIFDGLVDKLVEAGYGDRVVGLDSRAAFIEGDKIACKRLCREAGIPVAPGWVEVDAQNYEAVLAACLGYIHDFGGAVLKYPYSAGGKGARIILNTWDIWKVYEGLIKDYKDKYVQALGKNGSWPLLIEARMSGVEISFTILVDGEGHFQILPTALDYPERFPGPPSVENPITGGMGSISPHPLETPDFLAMAEETIAFPLVKAMKERGILRPCVLYPGCFASLDAKQNPVSLRVCEVNIRPGEPEFQPVVRRLRNLGALIEATVKGNLDEVYPEVRTDQISICIALVTGPGGPQRQKGYPWSLTKGEVLEIDFDYFDKKRIILVPSAMGYDGSTFKSDGSRVVFLSANATVKPGQKRRHIANQLLTRLRNAFAEGRIRVIPRENPGGNRLDLRGDIGSDYLKAADIFSIH